MGKPLDNYLRRERRRLGLSQETFAYLIGCRNGSKISRYERFRRVPNLRTAFACAIVLHAPVQELFAGIYEDARQNVTVRAHLLEREMIENDGHKALRTVRTPRQIIAERKEGETV